MKIITKGMITQDKYRKFDGKKYVYNETFSNKQDAEARANALHKRGDFARIVHLKHGYGVYVRYK